MIDVVGLLDENDLDAHSAICLTYNLDLLFYDHYVRRVLRASRVHNQILFCDARQYQQALAELSHAPRCGRQYSVTPCHAPAAFHPKMYLLLGARAGRLILGSGNLSVGGLVRNAELFGVFDYREDQGPPHPAFAETVAYIGELAADGSDALRAQFERATGGAPWLRLAPKTDGRSLLLGGCGRLPLIERIRGLLAGRTVQELIVCSASFDRSLEGLRSLAALTQDRRLTCIVQPDTARLDGAAVRRIGKMVDWRPFIDPYPAEKKTRRDVRAHQKLFIFNCGDEELAVFGSANASTPALADAEGNVEALVALPWQAAGTTIKRLGLGKSLKADGIFNLLAKKSWVEDEDETEQGTFPFKLTSALVETDRISLTLACRPKIEQEAAIQLELAEFPGRPASTRLAVRAASRGLEAGFSVLEPSVRCARLLDQAGAPVSTYVALTWDEVRTLGASRSVEARYSRAVAAMADGVVLGTVLFELLDHFRDFEIVFSRSSAAGTTSDGSSDDNDDGDDRPTEAFYTDAIPGNVEASRWVGDRADLDLVVSLVQPLTTPPVSDSKVAEDDDEPNDDILDEEQERRGIDAKKGAATGDERAERATTGSKAMERASRRLSRRLKRAADAIEMALQAKDERKLKEISLASIARQVWMAHVAAFLAGRRLTSSDGDEILCLGEADFAEYVLRICRALAGGKAGGLLALLPEEAWGGPDSERVKRGLAFIETCCIWAVWWVRKYWQDCPDPAICADGVWDSAPDLIGARFLDSLRRREVQPDFTDLGRKLPVAAAATMVALEDCRTLLEGVAAALHDGDRQSPDKDLGARSWSPGDIALNAHLGITFVTGTDGEKVHLLDLSRASHGRRTYRRNVLGPITDPRLGSLVWRQIFPED